MSGIVPSNLKQAVVSPILKKDNLDRNCLKNYRPISNLPFIAKVLEKVAAKRLIEHLDKHNMHEELQSAYRVHHSTETALMKVHDDVTLALDKKRAVMLLLLDLSAAFDKLEVTELLDTLQHYFSVCGTALKWFESYMSDRYFRVQASGEMSKWVSLRYGVPQGSVLGPLLFSIYTTPMKDILQRHGVQYHKFADDLQIYVTYDPAVPSEAERAQKQLHDCVDEISQWMIKMKLKLNQEKTEYLLFTSKHQLNKFGAINITVGDSEIVPCASLRNLGAFMDKHNSAEAHVKALCRKCQFHLRRIGSIRWFLTRDILQSLVTTLVLSNIDYCNSLMCGMPATLVTRLQKLQNSAARMITGTPLYDHITPVLMDLHWLPVAARIRYKILLYVFKALHNMAPSYINQLLQYHQRPHNLRQLDNLQLLVPKTISNSTRAFSVNGPIFWNELPYSIRNESSLSAFKKTLKTFLFKQSYT